MIGVLVAVAAIPIGIHFSQSPTKTEAARVTDVPSTAPEPQSAATTEPPESRIRNFCLTISDANSLARFVDDPAVNESSDAAFRSAIKAAYEAAPDDLKPDMAAYIAFLDRWSSVWGQHGWGENAMMFDITEEDLAYEEGSQAAQDGVDRYLAFFTSNCPEIVVVAQPG